MFDRFTDRARKVMSFARQEAERFNHDYIGTEHILLGLVKEGSGVAANVLENLDVDLEKVRLEVEKLVKPAPDVVTIGQLPFTPRAKKVLEFAIDEARALDHNYVGTEHLLLGLLRENEGLAAQVLMNLGLKLDDVRSEVMEFLGAETQQGKDAAAKRRAPRPPPARTSGGGTPAQEQAGQQDPGLGQLRPRPDRIGARRQARSAGDPDARTKSNGVLQIRGAPQPRTIPCCLARPAWARPPSSKASRRWWWTATCPICCAASAWWCWTWR